MFNLWSRQTKLAEVCQTVVFQMTRIFLNGPAPFQFIVILFIHEIYRKTVGFSGIRTRIVGVKGAHADHLTTTSRLPGLFYLGHMMLRPPSIAIVWPVMKDAESDARKAIIAATSSTLPTRPIAWVVLQCSKNAAYLKLQSNNCVRLIQRFVCFLLIGKLKYILPKKNTCVKSHRPNNIFVVKLHWIKINNLSTIMLT